MSHTPYAARPVLETDAETSIRMGGIRQRDTTPELAVRRALARVGLRYRTHNRDLAGSPDIANRKTKWAVFVHGCYWHRHPDCRRATTPKRNTEFWVSKFLANVARDARSVEALRTQGYRVLTVWECESEDAVRLDQLARSFAAEVSRESDSMRAASADKRSSRSSGSPSGSKPKR